MECGEIEKLKLPLDDEGYARGFAFIEFKDKAACERALKQNDSEMHGRWLVVRMSADGRGRDPKGKDKCGKGKDGKGKGKKGKGSISGSTKAARSGTMGVPEGKKQTFEDSDEE